MKWVAGFLLLVNAGLFLWAHGHRPDSTAFIRPTVSGETMMLLSELSPAESLPAEPKAAAQETSSPPQPPLCLRIGPFHDAGLVEEVSGKLESLSVRFESLTVNSREIRAHRVYLGPFHDPSAVQAEVKRLNDKGVTEHYIKREAGEPDIISLGLFSQSTGADALVRSLQEKNIPAGTRTENRILEQTYWLELRDSEANRAAHDEIASTDWGDARTKLSEFPCS